MSLQQLVRFYHEVYLPIYSDLVGYLGDKPRQVLIEIENLLTHLVRHLDDAEEPAQKEKNLNQAFSHLVRVTIDCYKILWVEIKNDLLELEAIASGVKDRGVSLEEFFAMKQEFKRLSRVARAKEMEFVGRTPEDCLKAYEEVIYFGWNIIGDVKKNLILDAPSSTSHTGDDPPTWFQSQNSRLGRATTVEEGISELDKCRPENSDLSPGHHK